MKKDFFKEFDKADKKTWIEKATADLKGENPLEKFKWSPEPDISANPYYSSEDIEGIDITDFQNRLYKKDHPSGKTRHWDNLQEVETENEKEANLIALNALENGADGIIFNCSSQHTELDLPVLLKDIEAQYCALWFKNISKKSFTALNALTNNHFNLACKDPEQLESALTSAASRITVDFKIENRPTFTDQISELLKQTVQLVDTGNISISTFFNKHSLQYKLGTDFFGDIAGMRALRQLYFQIARAYNVNDFKPEDLHIIGVSAPWTNESYNPHANMLKGTTAGMAAILGGCDSLLIRPESDEKEYMSRIARNVSNVLKEESYFDSNADPVAGSYYLESLTQEFAKKAWSKFQQKVSK